MLGRLQFMKRDLTKTQTHSRFYTGLMGFCASIFLLAHSTAAEPFLAPGANVVLLSGLPGDLESETSYGDQLQSWLEILQGVATHSIGVLTDGADTLPAGIDARPASRSNFLAVAASLHGQTNPLIVIAWGHGGRQGSTPVFHVRGPRITVADFNTLAANVAAESRWLLFFRGSGIFARELAAPSRQIISSDAESGFSSDPIGLPLAARIVRGHPAIPWATLADELGPAITAWYKDRNLARTEEPALWLGEEHPRLLAKSTQESTLAAIRPNGAGTAPTNSAPESNQPPTEAQTAALVESPSAAWKEIHRIEPRDYLESDAVILRRRVSYTLGANPAISSEQDEFIQVLTAEGKRFGDFDISYSPPAEDISFLNCEVQRPDGGVVSLDPDAIREARDESLGEYQMGRRKFFSLPAVMPGAVLHVRYRTVWKRFPLPHISLQIPLAREIPTLDLNIEVATSKDAPFHFGFEGIGEKEAALAPPKSTNVEHEARNTEHADPSIHQSTYGSTYTWHFETMIAETHESLTAPHHGSRLMLSTFPDWNSFAEWYARISKLTDDVTPMISSKAAELTKDAKSDQEKVLALYHFVTGLRYVAVPLGVNSFRPHAAEKVLQNQYGDCKDKANLFNALLHSLDLSAELVLVPRFTQAHETLPGFAFNHAISRVNLDGKTLWVDTTDDICRFGLLPPGDPGRKVLVIASGTNTLTQLPSPNASEHRLKVTGEVDCSDPAGAVPASFSLDAFGYPDYEFRETAREIKDANSSLPLLSARFRTATGMFALEKQAGTSVAALDQNFSWKGEGTLIGITSQNANASERRITMRAPFWLPKEWDVALHRRSAPLFLNQGYPLTLEETLEFRLSPNTTDITMPLASQNENDPLRWRIKWSKSGKQLSATLRAQLVRGELNDAETRSFQEQLRSLMTALAESATISQ
jgi:hypothetical protein